MSRIAAPLLPLGVLLTPGIALPCALLLRPVPVAAPVVSAPTQSMQSAPVSLPPANGRDLDAEARAPATDVSLALSSRGVLGAWLIAGPFAAPSGKATIDTVIPGIDEKAIAFSLGTTLGGDRDLGGKRRPPAQWTLGWGGANATSAQDLGSENRPVDVKAILETKETEVIAYAAGKLHVERAGKYLLLLSVDDGVRAIVDGRPVFTRDAARPVRDDDDIVPLDLTAGEHDIVLKLHQRDGAWAFRARLLDATFSAPAGAWFRLPGTSAEDAKNLAAKMSWVSLDRGFDPSAGRYRPKLTVRFPEGAPRGTPLPVAAKLDASSGFDIVAGGVPVTGNGVGELVVALPPVDPLATTANVDLVVAGRPVRLAFPSRPASEQAVVRMERALAKIQGTESWLVPGSLESVKNLKQRLVGLLGKGDGDTEAQAEEAKELDRLAANLEHGADPYEGRSGMMRRAITSPLDDGPSELGLYVPPSYKRGTTRKYPLVVGLHGLNSLPMSMMRAIFGYDDAKRDTTWKDRHPVALPAFDAIVITPDARGNTMYRELGEDEVELAIQWARKVFPIDDARITVTGPSMGGIGSAALAFHRPHVFAASAPLCGYHSQLIRGDIANRAHRPWERFLLEERSNVFWAENGEHLPLYIVHGTKDLPEENSGVLIERYEKLKYSVKHEHPDAGHNVWQMTYEDQKGLKWLVDRRLDTHPAHVRFKTTRTRYGSSAWVAIDELASESGWAEVDARASKKTKVTLTSTGASAITLTKDDALFDSTAQITVNADGQALVFEANEPLALHRAPKGPWEKGPSPNKDGVKRGKVTGPIRDVFHEPILFVYGAEDDDKGVNEHVARGFAHVRAGVHVAYPIMSDTEFLAKKEPLANDRALFLVGRTNKVIAALEAAANTTFPLKVETGAVSIGSERFTGREVGAAFVRPNPVRPDRYVVVVAGADVPGTLRALSLPEVLPDFVVWDESLAPARWQIILGGGSVRAGGFFKKDWSLPATFADPFARRGAQPKADPEPAP